MLIISYRNGKLYKTNIMYITQAIRAMLLSTDSTYYNCFYALLLFITTLVRIFYRCLVYAIKLFKLELKLWFPLKIRSL